MFHSVGRILQWAKGYRKRMILGFVCSFFATWCTAGPVMLAAWALGRMIGNAWGENGLPASIPWLCLGGIVVLYRILNDDKLVSIQNVIYIKSVYLSCFNTGDVVS